MTKANIWGRCLFILTLLGLAQPVSAQQARILYYSSEPEIIRDQGKPGLAQVATIVRMEREANDNVLFVHGGASLGPSVLGALDRGAHMIDVLNILEPDLMAVGKREFSYKEDQFILHSLSAGFPFIASNIARSIDGEPFDGTEKNILLDLPDFNIGFVALTSANAITQYGATALTALPTDDVIRENARQLREDGADAVILLADTDFNDLSSYVSDGTVNAILYAHNFDNPYSVDTGKQKLREGALDGRLIILNLEKAEGAASVSVDVETIDLRAQEKDPEVESVINSYASRLEILLSQEVGTTTRSFNTIRNQVRTRESAFGNLVADAVRDAMRADVAFLNSGGIRGNRYYQSGQILTREDIQMELPFNNTVELFEVNGSQLRQALEWGIGCIETVDGCFLQVSNIKMSFDPSRPKGSRVMDIEVGGQPLDEGRTYRLGTLNFLANGGDGFEMLKNSPRLTQTGSGKLLWEVVASYLAKQATIEPKIEGRLVNSGNSGSENRN